MLPPGPAWVYELKFDGFRVEAIKSGGSVPPPLWDDKDFDARYPSIVRPWTPCRTRR